MRKAVASIITVIIYLLISVIILAIVLTSGIELLSNTKEQGNYKQMLEIFTNLKTTVEGVVDDKQTVEITIINPGEIVIDCNSNQITGNLPYKGKYRTDITPIENISTYKLNNKVYFEYDLNNYTRINLDCNNLILTNKNILTIKYLEYNEENDKILISIERAMHE